MTDNPAGIIHEPLPPNDPKLRQPDISKAGGAGMGAEGGPGRGHEATIAYFQQRMNEAK